MKVFLCKIIQNKIEFDMYMTEEQIRIRRDSTNDIVKKVREVET